jgi:hypothetical protein
MNILTDKLKALLRAIINIYSFIMASRIYRNVFMAVIVIFVYIGVGIFFYRIVFPKNEIHGIQEFASSQRGEPAVPKMPPTPQAEPQSQVVAPDNAGQLQAPDAASVMPKKKFYPKETQFAVAPERKISAFSKSGKKMTVNHGTKHAAGKSAVLKVTLKPSTSTAIVFLDGKEVSTQEIANGKSVNPGAHDIVAQAPGFEPFYGTATLEPGVTQVIDVSLTKAEKAVGLLHVYSYPWSDLYVDGVLQGTTPTPKPIAFQEGEHTLQLKRQGFKPYSETIHIEKDQVTRIQINLEKSDLSEN